MEDGEYLYSGNAWFKERLNGPDGRLWRKARRMFLFDHTLASALNLFKFDYRAVEVISRPDGVVLLGEKNTLLDENDTTEYRPGQSWNDDAQNSIRILLDRIVTRWVPAYMNNQKMNLRKLHDSLTPLPLQSVRMTYDETDNHVDNFNVKAALETYSDCLVPLHYHELWHEILHDYISVETSLHERESTIEATLFYNKQTFDEEEDTALVFGTNRTVFVDNYKSLSNKLGLFDLIVITVERQRYFGMIVHAERLKVKPLNEEQSSSDQDHKLKFDIHTTIGIYVSRECSEAIKDYQAETKDKQLHITKITNVTSTRRMLSAIHNLRSWPQHRSLLKPTIEDPYFQLPDGYDPSMINPTNQFNLTQSRAIAIAEDMFDDLQERMHLIHGPPGTGKSRTIAGIVLKLLQKDKSKKKILLCAPSNNACDELCRRILDEFTKQGVPYKNGTLVRVGCQPPDDNHLCEHFLDFIVLKDLVEVLRGGQRPDDNLATATEKRVMRNARIVVSTLNYCGSARMHPLRSNTEFIIVDEASQSLEADSLLPLRFNCTKLMLVGDPLQLRPCVLSNAGNLFNLSQSLYYRLYSIFENSPSNPVTMLDTQYRMHPDICRFPSRQFYGERLATDPSVAVQMKRFTLKPLYLYDLTRSFHETDASGSSFNRGEASFIQYFCRSLISHLAYASTSDASDEEDSTEDSESDSTDNDEEEDAKHRRRRRRSTPGEEDQSSTTSSHPDAETPAGEENEPHFRPISLDDPLAIQIQQRIAVITPYKAQIRLLRSCLPPYIEVMTADSSQGKEKDIVIISCVRSGDSIGFLNDTHRLNVMLTRSKNALYIVGNLSQLATQDENWKALLYHARSRRIVVNVDQNRPELPYR